MSIDEKSFNAGYEIAQEHMSFGVYRFAVRAYESAKASVCQPRQSDNVEENQHPVALEQRPVTDEDREYLRGLGLDKPKGQPVDSSDKWEDINIRVCKDEESKPGDGKWIEYMGVRYYAEAPKRESNDEILERVAQALFHYSTDKMPAHVSSSFGWPFGVTETQKDAWKGLAFTAINAFQGETEEKPRRGSDE